MAPRDLTTAVWDGRGRRAAGRRGVARGRVDACDDTEAIARDTSRRVARNGRARRRVRAQLALFRATWRVVVNARARRYRTTTRERLSGTTVSFGDARGVGCRLRARSSGHLEPSSTPNASSRRARRPAESDMSLSTSLAAAAAVAARRGSCEIPHATTVGARRGSSSKPTRVPSRESLLAECASLPPTHARTSSSSAALGGGSGGDDAEVLSSEISLDVDENARTPAGRPLPLNTVVPTPPTRPETLDAPSPREDPATKAPPPRRYDPSEVRPRRYRPVSIRPRRAENAFCAPPLAREIKTPFGVKIRASEHPPPRIAPQRISPPAGAPAVRSGARRLPGRRATRPSSPRARPLHRRVVLFPRLPRLPHPLRPPRRPLRRRRPLLRVALQPRNVRVAVAHALASARRRDATSSTGTRPAYATSARPRTRIRPAVRVRAREPSRVASRPGQPRSTALLRRRGAFSRGVRAERRDGGGDDARRRLRVRRHPRATRRRTMVRRRARDSRRRRARRGDGGENRARERARGRAGAKITQGIRAQSSVVARRFARRRRRRVLPRYGRVITRARTGRSRPRSRRDVRETPFCVVPFVFFGRGDRFVGAIGAGSSQPPGVFRVPRRELDRRRRRRGRRLARLRRRLRRLANPLGELRRVREPRRRRIAPIGSFRDVSRRRRSGDERGGGGEGVRGRRRVHSRVRDVGRSARRRGGVIPRVVVRVDRRTTSGTSSATRRARDAHATRTKTNRSRGRR